MKRPGFSASLVAAIVVLSVLAAPAMGADWPTYGCDSARSGVGSEALATPLHLQWTYVPRHSPRPAWPEPGRELHRMDFDYAYEVAIANGLVYFGSSADHKVYALDLATGQERWSFFTDGPVRFAPAVEGGRVFVACDDGWLYCLSAGEGELLWRFRGGPGDEMLCGNEQMISRWPLRSGVAVEDGIVYFTAGMWPAEGIYVYALRGEDATVIWKNDTSGHMYIEQPHAPSQAMTGVAPQGYVVVHEDQVFVPTGRNVPAVFDRKTGRFLYYRSRPNTWGDRWGGSWAFASGGLLFGRKTHVGPDIDIMLGQSAPWDNDGLIAFDRRTGKVKRELAGKHRAVVSDDTLCASGSGSVTAYDLIGLLEGSDPAECAKWEAPHDRGYGLVRAGDAVVVGGKDTVTAIGAQQGQVLWQSTVDGEARGLAAADGRLLVSTNTGQIACFGAEDVANPPRVSPETETPADLQAAIGSAGATLVGRVAEDVGSRPGYCLLLGVGDGRLAHELARRSELRICCIEPDPDKVVAARETLDAAGLYGVRVTVHQGSLSELPYPDYFANTIILDQDLAGGLQSCSAQELYRVLRPCGGTAYVSSGTAAGGASAASATQWLGGAAVPPGEIHASEALVHVVRGELPGAGEWTHQYANAGKSGASDDQRVRLPLKLLWFGKPGPAKMVVRHWKGPAPLSINGRLFVIGQHSVTAVDAYNGTELWYRELEGAGRFPMSGKSPNAAADADSAYVARGDLCLRLDAETGETKNEYPLPIPTESAAAESAEAPVWGYLSVAEDMVIGSIGSETESQYVFALGKDDGQLRWTYTAEETVPYNGIAVGEGMVHLVDATSAAKLEQMKRRGERARPKAVLLALDVFTGETVWRNDRGLINRNELRLAQGVLLATGGGRMAAYSAKDGKRLSWSGVEMRRFPIIVGDTVYGEPYAYDLRTGEQKSRVDPMTGEASPWNFSRSYGCGSVSGAPGLLMFRSSTVGFCDLGGDSGIHNFGGVRAGCYVNTIAANGLVLMPPGDAGCTCSYNYQTTVALVPTTRNEEWSIFSAAGAEPGTRVRQLALNFGVPGDRQDNDGKMWLAFPRPGGVRVPLEIPVQPPVGYYRRNADDLVIHGTDSPWLYASGCRGLHSATLDLILNRPEEMPQSEARTYTVRLHFAELENVQAGERVFDVELQDEVVITGLDVVKEAGARDTALVKEVTGVSAGDTLKLGLVPVAGDAASARESIISAIEVCEE